MGGAFTGTPPVNLLVDPTFAKELNDRQMSWRRIITLCVASGVPCPSLSASLSYFDTYRLAQLPANLTQAQRDFFGGHTYERIDAEGPTTLSGPTRTRPLATSASVLRARTRFLN